VAPASSILADIGLIIQSHEMTVLVRRIVVMSVVVFALLACGVVVALAAPGAHDVGLPRR
jgi:hypothetical protein